MLAGIDGPAVVISARTAAWLERYTDLRTQRVRHRGTVPGISEELEQIRVAAMAWRGATCGTEEATAAELRTDSRGWLSPHQAAGLIGISDRAVRKAMDEERLPAEWVGSQRRIRREDAEHFKAARETRRAG